MSTPAILRHRRDTAANWTSNNPVLEAGQLGYETDTLKFKLGDGTTAWTSLSYASGGTGSTGPTGPTGAGGVLAYYGSFYDSTDQALTSTTGAQAINIGSTFESSGVSLQSGSQVKFSYAGTYTVTFSAQLKNTNANIQTARLWFRKNGTDVADSNSVVDVPGTHGVGDGHALATVNYVATFAANDYIQVYWNGSNTSLSIETLASGTGPTRPGTPSIFLTACQITYQGVTGPTGPTGPTGAGGATNVWVPASDWIPRTTSGCGVNSLEASTNKVNYYVLEFDAAAIEYAQAMVVMPSNWNAGTVTAKFSWTAASGSGDVIWQLSGRAYANDDAIDQATGTAKTATDTLTAANDVNISPATSAITLAGTAANGNPVVYELSRKATDAGDTLAVDARLLGVEISYTSS